ncbi:hypothetical protein PFISCL1PPCAC_2736, partial [Pristionchus fissidentatus]
VQYSTNFTISESGLRWATEGGLVKIDIRFVAHWFLFNIGGYAYFTALDLRTNIQATVHNRNGRPEIEMKSCWADVGKVKIKIKAGLAWDVAK